MAELLMGVELTDGGADLLWHWLPLLCIRVFACGNGIHQRCVPWSLCSRTGVRAGLYTVWRNGSQCAILRTATTPPPRPLHWGYLIRVLSLDKWRAAPGPSLPLSPGGGGQRLSQTRVNEFMKCSPPPPACTPHPPLPPSRHSAVPKQTSCKLQGLLGARWTSPVKAAFFPSLLSTPRAHCMSRKEAGICSTHQESLNAFFALVIHSYLSSHSKPGNNIEGNFVEW